MSAQSKLNHWIKNLLRLAAVVIMVVAMVRQTAASHFAATTPTCGSATGQDLPPGGSGEDLEVTGGVCNVLTGMHHLGNVNIYNGGTLKFPDAPVDFWAKSILIENSGTLQAGDINAATGTITPLGTLGRNAAGTNSHVLDIHLYGPEAADRRHGLGILCKTDSQCGIPNSIWNPNNQNPTSPVTMSNGVTDYFYNYTPLPYDDGADPTTKQQGFFGYKVLALSYGGTLQLFGAKGASYDAAINQDPSKSGASWARLNTVLAPPPASAPAPSTFMLDRVVDWQAGDEIAISSTDYLPGHAEQLTIATNTTVTDPKTGKNVSQITTDIAAGAVLKWPHNGVRYPLKIPAGMGPTLPNGDPLGAAETRAAVALLSRSIVIESANNFGDTSFPAQPGNFFGGHTIFREGFLNLQVQGVEFARLGQGGKLGHYPVHFHISRKAPPNTYVKDSSINESMTRWYVLHATQNVLLQRNVGYLSVGHGYYLEDGTETDNKFYSNLGVLARGAVDDAMVNPRSVPGILAAPDYPILPGPPPKQLGPADDVVPYHSDWDHPTDFWIMNGWNDFEYNMAAGAGTCGICYWLLPGINSGVSSTMIWDSYASEQSDAGRAGTSPLQEFLGNYCSSAMNSFNTVANTSACFGVQVGPNQANPIFPVLNPVKNDLAPSANSTTPDENGFNAKNFYPQVGGGGRFPTKCPASGDCSKQPVCADGSEGNCVITALDQYTSAFHWTETNFAAVWLRPQWYLFLNSVLSDVQNGGITFVTGGGYTRSDVIPGHWALARKNAFVGTTQNGPNNQYTTNGGAFSKASGLKCATATNGASPGNYCLSADDELSVPLSNFGDNQRLFNIYDGPSYEDANAYLDITPTNITDCQPNMSAPANTCFQSAWSAGGILGMPYDPNTKTCYLPNAAIAWKQPNGFYYPPAFHSKNLFFDNVGIRHFVIEPLFKTTGRFQTDPDQVKQRYCTWNDGMFTGFTDVDRQTELNDDDGSLTGLVDTISVNEDPFFNAPVSTAECLSDVGVTPERAADPTNYPGTAKTSPYSYVSSVVFPDCAAGGKKCTGEDQWNSNCGSPNCSGVPLYRLNLTAEESQEKPLPTPFIRMMGQDKFQRSTLTANNNTYYIDTTPSAAAQNAGLLNVFQAGKTYYVFLLFAQADTKQTYELYVGKDPAFDRTKSVFLTRVDLPGAYNFSSNGANPWPDGWSRVYDPSSGILTVTMDMSAIANFKTEYSDTQQAHCQPASFCKWDASNTSNQCQCAASSGGGILPAFLGNECTAQDSAICSSAIRDVDCPEGGCYGFGVTLSPLFTTSDTPIPPPPATCYPNNTGWNLPFQGITDATDACFYMDPPAGAFCAPPGAR
ncbi:MAG TPA: hypothetical protein VKS22_09045 [Candidatus Binataceae bacterium]|nr:hypothetical protein [Candidatus Binataceae bacterium]